MHGTSNFCIEEVEVNEKKHCFGMEDSYFPYISNHETIVDNNDNIIHSLDNSPQYQITSESILPKELDENTTILEESNVQELTEADVYTQLEKKERDLVLAAELGKALLEQNEELRGESEKLDDQYRQKIEELEQQKYGLQQHLQRKEQEMESIGHELNSDVMALQEELEQQRTQMKAMERENVKIVEELSEQNQKLLDQLNRASKAEEQLTSQVQQLRKDFMDRSAKSTSRINQLESLKEELFLACQIQQGVDSNTILENRYRTMCEDRDQAVNALADATERMKIFEKQLHEKDRELNRTMVELSDAHNTSRQLQIRIDELREEMSLQMSFNSGTGTESSLLSEMEQSGLSQDGLMELSKSVASLAAKDSPEDTPSGGNILSDVIIPPDVVMTTSDEQCTVPGKVFSCIVNAVNNCLTQIIELKQDIWDSYLKLRKICDILHPMVVTVNISTGESDHKMSVESIETNNNEVPKFKDFVPGGLMQVVGELQGLVEKVVEKDNQETEKESSPATISQFDKIVKERDEAKKSKKLLEVEVARTKADLLQANSQLIEAIQQKVDQQRELEAWHDDMELMIQKALTERNEATQALSRALRKNAEAGQSLKQTPTKSSWLSSFSFRSRNSPGAESPQNGETSSPAPSPGQKRQLGSSPSLQSATSRISSWLKRRQTSMQDENRDIDSDSVISSASSQPT